MVRIRIFDFQKLEIVIWCVDRFPSYHLTLNTFVDYFWIFFWFYMDVLSKSYCLVFILIERFIFRLKNCTDTEVYLACCYFVVDLF